MFRIKLKRPGRGIIAAVAGVIVLAGAVGLGVLETFAVNRRISKAKEEFAALGGQIRDCAVLCGVYSNGLARPGKSRKLIDQAESAQRKLWILRGERKELVSDVEEMGAVERLLVRKEFERALDFCDEQIIGCQSRLDDLFGRLSIGDRYLTVTERGETDEFDSSGSVGRCQ